MNERERWIVYPLLFLALGAALRDKLIDRTTTKRIVCEELMVCEELTVVDGAPTGRQAPRPLIQMGRTNSSPGGIAQGLIIVNGHVKVAGQLDANQYAYTGIPVSIPFFIPMNLIRALHSQGGAQQGNQN